MSLNALLPYAIRLQIAHRLDATQTFIRLVEPDLPRLIHFQRAVGTLKSPRFQRVTTALSHTGGWRRRPHRRVADSLKQGSGSAPGRWVEDCQRKDFACYQSAHRQQTGTTANVRALNAGGAGGGTICASACSTRRPATERQ